MRLRTYFFFSLLVALGTLAGTSTPAAAQDQLCDPGNEDCRALLISYIRNEKPVAGAGIDVAFWFMEDARYTSELIARHKAGVKVRVLVDTDANGTYTGNAARLQALQDAGIPMRHRTTSNILHWKMMLFRSQGVVEFSGANYSANAFEYGATSNPPQPPYANYTDEAIFFAKDKAIVDSFREKFDDFWTSTVGWANYANISEPLTRVDPDGTYVQDPQLNFPPEQNYRTRALARYSAARTATNGKGVDVIMYRITDARHTDAMIALQARGVPVRLYTEQAQYRLVDRMWHSWNVDRLYMAQVQIRDRAHAGLNHQKSVILHDQDSAPGDQPMVIFGSSNWTSPSANGQVEHNMFTTRSDLTSWFVDQFERKWNNLAALPETKPFTPLPPDTPKSPSPANLASGINPATPLRWNGGPWAHLYDLQIATDQSFTNIVFSRSHRTDLNLREQPSKTAASTFPEATKPAYALPPGLLQAGTTYYWRVTGLTMAEIPKVGPIWSFTTAGTAPPPPPPPTTGTAEVVLYASKALLKQGWVGESQATAAGAQWLRNPNLSAAKISTASASPANFFELTFNAERGRGYRLWVRGQAVPNSYANDSVFVQFNNSVASDGVTPIWRIGTTSATEVNLEDCSSCGISGWGWQDNGWGVNVMGPLVYFGSDGPQTIRVQVREDGFAIDQIVLSHTTFVNSSPGKLKNDTTILAEADGTGTPPPPPPPPPTPATTGEIVLLTSSSTSVHGAWSLENDASAAGGSKLRHPDGGVAKLSAPIANPTHYFELTFSAEAGRPYHLWLRGRADTTPSSAYYNDSVFVQFSGSVTQSGTATWRIGTASATDVNLEDCSGCGQAGWGWQDNGWGSTTAMGPDVFFEETGPQTIRIQTREDGFAIDQVVLSPSKYLTAPPGPQRNDNTRLTVSGSN